MDQKITCGDLLFLRKKHPCGSDQFEVLRVGSDLRIRCKGCGHDLTISRIKLEPRIKSILKKEDSEA